MTSGSSGPRVQLWTQRHLKWFNLNGFFHLCNDSHLSKYLHFLNILSVKKSIYCLYLCSLMYFNHFIFYFLITTFCQGSLDMTKVEIMVKCNHFNFKGWLERQWLYTSSPLSCSSLNISPDVVVNNGWDFHISISAPCRRELRSQTWPSLPLVHGQPWEGHQRLTVLHVSNNKPYKLLILHCLTGTITQ